MFHVLVLSMHLRWEPLYFLCTYDLGLKFHVVQKTYFRQLVVFLSLHFVDSHAYIDLNLGLLDYNLHCHGT